MSGFPASHRRRSLLSSMALLLFALLPTYFQSLLFKSRREPRKLHRTSFLDGLRGVAALIVVINHHCMNYKRYFQEPFTFGPYEEGEDPINFTHPMQLPILRIAITGGAMVPIFFVISGYVLSFRLIKMIKNRQYEELGERLFSSAFRRPFRLFLPSVAGIIIFQVTNELGWNPMWEPSKLWLRPLPNVLWSILMMFDAVWIVSPEKHGTYLQQLWTIPMEYFGSIVVFVTLMTISRLRPFMRLLSIVTPMVVCHVTGHWWASVFLAGVLIAELEPPQDERVERDTNLEDWQLDDFETTNIHRQLHLNQSPKSDLSLIGEYLSNTFWLTNLVMGLFIAGWPEAHFDKDPFLSGLPLITPKHLTVDHVQVKWYWLGIAAVQIVWCIYKSPALQRIFTTKLALYLGDISYAIYIVHYHLTLSLGPRIHKYANGVFGMVDDRASHMTHFVAVVFELSVILFVAFWEADLFMRYVDRPCVRFAKWFEIQVRVQSG
jgi:peptidoglycan/LPS O-acetylase OafA/YrhL